MDENFDQDFEQESDEKTHLELNFLKNEIKSGFHKKPIDSLKDQENIELVIINAFGADFFNGLKIDKKDLYLLNQVDIEKMFDPRMNKNFVKRFLPVYLDIKKFCISKGVDIAVTQGYRDFKYQLGLLKGGRNFDQVIGQLNYTIKVSSRVKQLAQKYFGTLNGLEIVCKILEIQYDKSNTNISYQKAKIEFGKLPNKKDIVTKTLFSRHIFGESFDISLYKNGIKLNDDKQAGGLYTEILRKFIDPQVNLTNDGLAKKFGDLGHIQYKH